VIVPPLALILGALAGYVVRGHRRAVLVLALATPAFSLLAFAAQFVPGGAESCTSSISGAQTCNALPAVSGWSGPLPYTIAVALLLLALVPLVSFRLHDWRPAAASAVLQAVPQVVSFGGFLDWAPALLLTVAVAFALARRRSESFN